MRNFFKILTFIILLINTLCIQVGCSGNTNNTPNDNNLQSILITSIPITHLGINQQFTATGIYANGDTNDITASVTWISSNPVVATIVSGGLATPLAAGSTAITASLNNITSNTSILNVSAAPLQSISITPINFTTHLRINKQFIATGIYSDGTQEITNSVVWLSSNTTIATIANGGLATPIATGSTIITANLNNILSNAANLIVSAAPLLSISITPTTFTTHLGINKQFIAIGTYSDGTQDISNSVKWLSSNTAIATIVSGGLATPIAAGSTNITASLNIITSNTSILTVSAAPLQSISITPTKFTTHLGINKQFTATGIYSDGAQDITNSVIWISSNAAIATMANSGLATPIIAGSTIITAQLKKVTSNTSILTVSAAPLQSISIFPANLSISLGSQQQFVATGNYSDGVQDISSNVIWDSSNTAIATIGDSGLATTVAIGSTTIKASFLANFGSTNLTVNNTVLSFITISPANFSTNVIGSTIQYTATGTNTDGSTQNLTTAVVWSSSNQNVASISNDAGSQGLATAKAPNTTTIAASFSGISGSTTLSVSPHYIYFTTASNNIAIYSINNSTGLLTFLGYTPTGNGPTGIAVAPSGNYLYVNNSSDSTLSIFKRTNSNGSLSSLGTIATGATPYGMAITPSGNYLYVTNYAAASVQMYRINSSTGLLTSLGTIASGTNPYSLTISPSGAYVYVTNNGNANVQIYSINSTTGLLTSLGTIASGNGPYEVAITPSGAYAYVTNFASNSVSMYSVNSSTGLLTSLGTIPAGVSTSGIAISPTGNSVYTTNLFDNNLSMYSINSSTGLLTSLGTIPAGTSPYQIALIATTSSNTYAYVTNNLNNTLSIYNLISSTNLLSFLSLNSTGLGPYKIVIY